MSVKHPTYNVPYKSKTKFFLFYGHIFNASAEMACVEKRKNIINMDTDIYLLKNQSNNLYNIHSEFQLLTTKTFKSWVQIYKF